ncbi:MAG: FMN-binding negative transcriptional regulator [Chitinophagaceae bacterium]
MYNLPYFKEKDIAVVKQFMKANPFAIITGCDVNNQPVATQVPLLLEERNEKLFLLGHVQRKTDHQLALEQNPHMLAVFTGPHTYVSASWYSNPQTASTWNYISVHAKGVVKFLDDAALLSILSRTTALFENDTHSPALVEKMPEEYVSKMMKAIVAFEMEVTQLDNVFKLSQNRDKENFAVIADKLKAQGGQPADIAHEMEKRGSQLFNENKS